jgi:hypothetical protein
MVSSFGRAYCQSHSSPAQFLIASPSPLVLVARGAGETIPQHTMKLKKTEDGYITHDGRFRFIRGKCLTSRNGCYATSWRMLDHGKLVTDYHEEDLKTCKEWAQCIVEDEASE